MASRTLRRCAPRCQTSTSSSCWRVASATTCWGRPGCRRTKWWPSDRARAAPRPGPPGFGVRPPMICVSSASFSTLTKSWSSGYRPSHAQGRCAGKPRVSRGLVTGFADAHQLIAASGFRRAVRMLETQCAAARQLPGLFATPRPYLGEQTRASLTSAQQLIHAAVAGDWSPRLSPQQDVALPSNALPSFLRERVR